MLTTHGTPASPDLIVPQNPQGDDLARRAAMILSAMDAAGQGRAAAGGDAERREDFPTRRPLRGQARLRLFADARDAEPWALFLRDVEPRAIGFVCPDRLPLGYGGRLDFQDARTGEAVSVDITLVRCRVSYGGWYEGAAFFHRPQPRFGS